MKQHTLVMLLLLLVILSLFTPSYLCATSGLFGLTGDVALIKINPQTFSTLNVGKPLPHIAQSQSLSDIDNKNKLFYFIGFDLVADTTSLLALSLDNGTIVNSVELPFASSIIIGVGQYVDVDPNTGDVIVTGREDDGDHHVYRVNPKTKAITPLATIGDSDVLGGFSAYDSINNIEYIEVFDDNSGEFVIIGVDAIKGNTVTTINDSSDYDLESLNFDPKTGLFFGIGLNFTNDENNRRTLLSLNGKTGKFKEVAVIPGYYIISSSVSALDVAGRRLFAFLSPVGDNDDFDLITVNIDTGKLLYTSRACSDDADCPWNIEYFSG